MLPAGRALAFDDVGDPQGVPIVYLHGTPDSRLARHPDDALARRAGVRLVAVDRPGYGGSSALPPGSPPSRFADDLDVLLDHLDVDRASLLAWSGGALAGLGAAASPSLAGRLTALHLVAAIVPFEAYDDSDVRNASVNRQGLLDMAEDLPPTEVAEIVAPLLAPFPCDLALALEHQRLQRDPDDHAALAGVPGARRRLAESLVQGVRRGLAGVQADVEAQVSPDGVDLDGVTVPVRLWYGTADVVTPAVLGRWYAHALPDADLRIVDGGGHYLPFTHWSQLLADVRD